MLPRLQAEDQIAAISAIALGGGNVDEFHARQTMRRLELCAEGLSENPRGPASPAVLAAIGIAVVMEPADG